MRFAWICFLSTVAAAGAIPRTGAAASGTRKVATLTGGRRPLHAGSETKASQASPLTEHGSHSERHAVRWSKVAVAKDGEADVKGQLVDTREQRSQQEHQHGDRHKKSCTTEGKRLRARRNRQATTSPAAHSRRNDETEEKKHSEEKKSNSKGSDGEGRTDKNGAEEKGADSGPVANSAEVAQTHSTPKERSAEPEYQGKEEVSAQNTGTHVNTPAATNALQDTNALADVPMTREQRLELLLDYHPILPGDADQDNRTKSSRGHSNKERQKTTHDTRRTPRSRRSMATTQLLQAARQSTGPPRYARSERTTKSKSLRCLAVAAVLLTCFATAVLYGYEDRGRLRVNVAKHSPFFAALQHWASLRRAALGVEPDLFRLRDL